LADVRPWSEIGGGTRGLGKAHLFARLVRRHRA